MTLSPFFLELAAIGLSWALLLGLYIHKKTLERRCAAQGHERWVNIGDSDGGVEPVKRRCTRCRTEQEVDW